MEKKAEEKGLGKKISRRTFLKYGTVATIGGIPFGKLGAAGAQTKRPIIIGIASEVSGNFADDSASERRGMIMAIDEFNAKGGVLGRKVEYRVEDTESDPSAATRKAKRLIDRERVDFVTGAIFSTCANAISEVCQREGVVYINSNGSSNVCSNENCHKVSFTVDANSHMFNYAVGPWAARNLGKKWYYFTHDYTWGKSGTAAFRSIMKAEGGEEVGEILVPLGTRDFSAQLIKVINAKPDCVMVTIGGLDTAAFMEQVVDFGAHKKLNFVFTLKDFPAVWSTGPEKNFGIFGYTWYHKFDLPGVKDFVARYKKRWPDASIPVPDNESYNGYIAVRELLRAVERAGTTRSHDVIKALEGWTFTDNMRHHPTTIRDFDHQFIQTMYVMKAKPKEQMTDNTDFMEVIGIVKPEDAAYKRAESRCKMESYADTPGYWLK